MTEEKDDKLEQYLEGNSKVSQAYGELGDEAPPPELDARILAAAEREVKVTGIDARRAPPFKAFAWAAVFVLSFSLVLNILFDESVRAPVEELGRISESENETMAVPMAESKARRDQPVMDEKNHEEYAVMARKREASADPQAALRELAAPESDQSEKVRAKRQRAASAPPQSVRQLTDDAFLRDQTVAVLEGFAMELQPSTLAARPAERIDEPDMELQADSSLERDPETELREILEAFHARRDAEAFAALAEFRETYPDHLLTRTLTERGL